MSKPFFWGVSRLIQIHGIKKGDPGDLPSPGFQAINLGIFLYTDLTEQMVVDQNGHPPKMGETFRIL